MVRRRSPLVSIPPGRDDVLVGRIVELVRRDKAVEQRLFHLGGSELPLAKRLMLARVVSQFGTLEAVLAGLELINDGAIDSCIINVLYSGREICPAPGRNSRRARTAPLARRRAADPRPSARRSSSDGGRESTQRPSMESRLPEERSPGDRGAACFRATTQTARPPDAPIGAGTVARREGGRVRHQPVDLPAGGALDRATFPRPLSRGPYWSLAPLARLEPPKACPAGRRAR